jgi:hypothetical protein
MARPRPTEDVPVFKTDNDFRRDATPNRRLLDDFAQNSCVRCCRLYNAVFMVLHGEEH